MLMFSMANMVISDSTKANIRNLDTEKGRNYGKSLQEYFELDQIPADYGGTGPKLPQPGPEGEQLCKKKKVKGLLGSIMD